MDAADGLQFSSDSQEAEYYLLSAYEFYKKLGPDVGTENIEMLTGLILIECSNHSTPYIDEPYLDILRSETLAMQTLCDSYPRPHRPFLHGLATPSQPAPAVLPPGPGRQNPPLRALFSQELETPYHGSQRRSVQPRCAGRTGTRRTPVYVGRRAGAEGNGAAHRKSKKVLKNLKKFERRGPDLRARRFEAFLGARGLETPACGGETGAGAVV
jgi:hypothetical protein